MLRSPHKNDGQCDIDMRCADNTATKLVVVIAAAVVANAESYSKSFSVQQQQQQLLGMSEQLFLRAAAKFKSIW